MHVHVFAPVSNNATPRYASLRDCTRFIPCYSLESQSMNLLDDQDDDLVSRD